MSKCVLTDSTLGAIVILASVDQQNADNALQDVDGLLQQVCSFSHTCPTTDAVTIWIESLVLISYASARPLYRTNHACLIYIPEKQDVSVLPYII